MPFVIKNCLVLLRNFVNKTAEYKFSLFTCTLTCGGRH